MEYILRCSHPVAINVDVHTGTVLGLITEKCEHCFEAKDDDSTGDWIMQHLEGRVFLTLPDGSDGAYFHPDPQELLQGSHVIRRW